MSHYPWYDRYILQRFIHDIFFYSQRRVLNIEKAGIVEVFTGQGNFPMKVNLWYETVALILVTEIAGV